MTRSHPTDDELISTMLSLLAERGDGKSICPSEVPRQLLGETGPWRSHLKRTRTIAQSLAKDGRVVILRHGKPIGDGPVKGVIRLARGPCFEPPDGAGDTD